MKVKKNYGYAKLLRIVEASKYRVDPACKVAKACGGCQLQSTSYEMQLEFKEKKVISNLKRIGGIEEADKGITGQRIYSSQLLTLGFASIIRQEKGWDTEIVYRLSSSQYGHHQKQISDATDK